MDAVGPAAGEPARGLEEALASRILELLDAREAGRTICPSEAARAVFAESQPEGAAEDDGWRDLMEPARRAASRLVEQGVVVVTQGGEVVDLATARGPVRLRRRE